MAGEVELVDLVKRFGDVVAVDGISMHIPGGEFFSMLGPSGCGKTTTLRLIAGFERPTEGRILLDGTDMAQTPPHKRNVNTVFQCYALFPFLTVEENVAFGLRFQKTPKDDTKRRVGEALAMVRLTGFEKRRPTQLSGGQQQRVALARALVLNPAVLLLDEPLGALDAKLRKALQIELKALQEEVGLTFIYVTHDQEEALTMSDRIAVMSNGRVEQVGSPEEVYEEPRTAYVADFLGVSNLMSGQAQGLSGNAGRVSLGDFELAGGARRHGRPRRRQARDPARARGARRPDVHGAEPRPGHGRAGAVRGFHPSGPGPPGTRRDAAGVDPESRRRSPMAAGIAGHGAPAPWGTAHPGGHGRHRRGRGDRAGTGRLIAVRPACRRRCRRADPSSGGGRARNPISAMIPVEISMNVAAALMAGVGVPRVKL